MGGRNLFSGLDSLVCRNFHNSFIQTFPIYSVIRFLLCYLRSYLFI
jgi:hypothetical protein